MAAAAPAPDQFIIPTWDSEIERGTVGFERVCQAVYGTTSPEARDDFRAASEKYLSRLLDAFQANAGDIVESFYCGDVPGGCAVTRKARARGSGTDFRFHTVTPPTTAQSAPVAALITEVERLCIDANELLNLSERETYVRRVFSVASYLHALLNNMLVPGKLNAEDVRSEVALRRSELARIERDYLEDAQRDAQLTYFHGMLIGLGLTAVVALAAVGLVTLADVSGQARDSFLAAFGGGASGAFVSVLTRMSSGRLRLNFRTGTRYLRRLGAFRPLIGAVMASALYFLIVADVLSVFNVPDDEGLEFAFFCGIGFVAGFSERWAQDMLALPQASARRAAEESTESAPETTAVSPMPKATDDEVARPALPEAIPRQERARKTNEPLQDG